MKLPPVPLWLNNNALKAPPSPSPHSPTYAHISNMVLANDLKGSGTVLSTSRNMLMPAGLPRWSRPRAKARYLLWVLASSAQSFFVMMRRRVCVSSSWQLPTATIPQERAARHITWWGEGPAVRGVQVSSPWQHTPPKRRRGPGGQE